MISLEPTHEQQQIIDSVADVLQSRCPVERLRNRKAAPGEAERREWQRFAELGWFGLGLPEAAGGTGYSVVEEVLAFREFGRFLLTPAVLSTSLGAHIAAGAGQSALAESILSGAEKVALAMPAGAAGSLSLSATAARGDLHLVDAADAGLVAIWTDDGAALLRRADLGAIAGAAGMDTTISLERASAERAAPVAFVSSRNAPLPMRAQLLAAAQLVGMAEAARDLAAGYAGIRQQFGKPIGSFQAVAHHCADMALRVSPAWAQTRFAALALHDQRADEAFQISAASLLSGDAAFRNATMAIRVHGGIGFTADCDVHHFLKRSVLLRRAGGGEYAHSVRLLAAAQPV